jgi:hypothetical protein
MAPDRCEALEESRAQPGVAVEDINSGQQKLEAVDWTDAFVPEAPPGTVSAECISHRVVLRETMTTSEHRADSLKLYAILNSSSKTDE